MWNLELTGPHVWRQTQTQQTIDSFAEEDFNILNPRKLERGAGDGISRLDFPLYQWLVAALGKLGGTPAILSRMVSFLISCVMFWGIYALIVAAWSDRFAALVGAFAGALSPAIYYYGTSPLPDILALALGVWALVFLVRSTYGFHWGQVSLSLALVGLATLAKLPYILFAAGHIVWWVHHALPRGGWGGRRLLAVLALGLLALVPAVLWYAWAMPTWGASTTLDSLAFNNWDGAKFLEYVRFQLLEMYPRTLLSVALVPLFCWGCVQWFIHPTFKASRLINRILVAVAVATALFDLLEINVIGIYHDYYLLPAVPLLAIPVAMGGSHLLGLRKVWPQLMMVALIGLVPLMTYRRIHPRWRPENAEFNRDWVIYSNQLRAAVPEDALVVAGPDVSHNISLSYIHKKGWCWDHNQTFDATKLDEWHALGAQYLYCDDRSDDHQAAMAAKIGSPIAQFGSIFVYRLR
jgi:hypothetical protein